MPAVSTVSAPAGKTVRRPVPAKRAPLRTNASKTAQIAKQIPPVPQTNGHSPFEIMAGRIANRVAEMAENVTFVEREQYVSVRFHQELQLNQVQERSGTRATTDQWQEKPSKARNSTVECQCRRRSILSTIPRQHSLKDASIAEQDAEDRERDCCV